jgi:hypothetical protein
MIFRAGNADGTPMNRWAFGWTIHSAPVKSILTWLLSNNYITNAEIPEVDLMSVAISKISGKAASANTPADLTVSSLKFKNSPGLSEDDGVTSMTFDGSCNGAVSPYTFGDNLKNGYFIVPSTFMPNGMDLPDITQRFNEATSYLSGGSVTWGLMKENVSYNYRNIFVEMPTEMCPDVIEKPDANISVAVSAPNANSTIYSDFTLSYTIAGPKNIRRVLVLLNKQQIASFDYPAGDTKRITDTKQVVVSGTWFKNNEYTLEVIAFDFAGFSNKATIPVTLNLGTTPPPPPVEDTEAPRIDTANIKVSKNADNTYSVIIPLKDVTAVVTGKITRNGVQLYEFKNSVATADFQVSELGPVVVTAADPAGNQLNQTIDLTTYLK